MHKRREFRVVLARVTEADVISDSIPQPFPVLEDAEWAMRQRQADYDGGCIYEIEVRVRDGESGIHRMETELSTRNYVKDGEGRFVLDEMIATEA